MSPAVARYVEAKRAAPDSILVMRFGDFWEALFDDAVAVSKALDVALTTRSRGEEKPVPMCGFPVHSQAQCVEALEAAGYKVTFA